MPSSELAAIAPRLARAVEQERAHAMRGIERCSCGWGWRIVGHEYRAGGGFGCIDRLDWAKKIRDGLAECREETGASDDS